MPSVRMASESVVNFIADRITRWNSRTSITMWSLGVTTMLAFGLRAFIFQLT